MKKRIVSACSIFSALLILLIAIVWVGARQPEVQYTGRTRDSIVSESARWKGRLVPDKITVGTSMTYLHFDTPDEIRQNKELMNADLWRINYRRKKGFLINYVRMRLYHFAFKHRQEGEETPDLFFVLSRRAIQSIARGHKAKDKPEEQAWIYV